MALEMNLSFQTFLAALGREQETAVLERGWLEKCRTLENYNDLMAACLSAGLYRDGYAAFQEAQTAFPADAAASPDSELVSLFTLGGDLCKKLKKYEEAFEHWNKALSISTQYIDAMYSIALCHRELYHYKEEAETWQRIIDWLEKKGTLDEIRWTREMLASAMEKQEMHVNNTCGNAYF